MKKENDKFTELAEKRVTKALKDIRLIGNLASPNYKRTDYQIACIQQALENAVAECMARFEAHYKQDVETFSFDNYETDETIVSENDDIETIVHTD